MQLIEEVKNNRKDNAENCKIIEARVLEVVRKKHKRDSIDAKAAAKGKRKATHMASAHNNPDDCDMEDYSEW